MKNVKIDIDKETNIMTLSVDLNADTEPSASGKTEIVATTSGNQNIEGNFVGLNIFRYPAKAKPKEESEESEE